MSRFMRSAIADDHDRNRGKTRRTATPAANIHSGIDRKRGRIESASNMRATIAR